MSKQPMAFPFSQPSTGNSIVHEQGMTLRDWFAGQALVVAWAAYDKGYYEGDNGDVAACAYQLADAMMKEREK